MKYAKYVYGNRLADSHLDFLSRVARSDYKPDLSKTVKELSQYQNTRWFTFLIKLIFNYNKIQFFKRIIKYFSSNITHLIFLNCFIIIIPKLSILPPSPNRLDYSVAVRIKAVDRA